MSIPSTGNFSVNNLYSNNIGISNSLSVGTDLTVDTTNNVVGIGTNNPDTSVADYRCHINGSTLITKTTTEDLQLDFESVSARRTVFEFRDSTVGSIYSMSCGGSTYSGNNNYFNLSKSNGNVTGVVMRVNDDLHIGINNDTPSHRLDVIGDINTTENYNINSIEVLNSTTLGSGIINSSLTNVGTLTSLDISGDLSVNTSDLFVDTTNNVVGIGTNSPDSTYKCDIIGNTRIKTTSLTELHMVSGPDFYNAMRFKDTTVGDIYSLIIGGSDTFPEGISNRFDIRKENGIYTGSIFRITDDGIIGIKNELPSHQLDVTGDINTTENYNINGIEVLNASTLGSGITNSSLTNVGTLTSLDVSGDFKVDVTGEQQSILESNDSNSSLIIASTSNNDSYLTVRKESTSASYCFGIDASDNNKLKINYLNALAPVNPSTGTTYLTMEPPGNITMPAGDLDISSGNLTVNSGITGNEVFVNSCNQLGCLGMKLVGKASETDFLNQDVDIDFTDYVNDFTDNLTMIKIYYNFLLNGNTNPPRIELQCFDYDGGSKTLINGTNQYHSQIFTQGGTGVYNAYATSSRIFQHFTNASGNLYGTGELLFKPVGINGNANGISWSGQCQAYVASENERASYQVHGGLNGNQYTLLDYISKIRFSSGNVDNVSEFHCKVFVMN